MHIRKCISPNRIKKQKPFLHTEANTNCTSPAAATFCHHLQICSKGVALVTCLTAGVTAVFPIETTEVGASMACTPLKLMSFAAGFSSCAGGGGACHSSTACSQCPYTCQRTSDTTPHLSGTICHLSGSICHVSGTICHLKGTICHFSGPQHTASCQRTCPSPHSVPPAASNGNWTSCR